MKFLALSICLPLALSCFAKAQADVVKKSPSIVRFSIEWIEMSSGDVTHILRAPRTTTNDTDLRDKVDKMIGADKAAIYESKVLTTRLGTPSRVESIREEIYPTEYDPPELPGTFYEKKDGTTAPKSLMSAFMPTAFETRNTGVTFEVDPSYDAETNTLNMSMEAELVNIVDQNKFATYKDEHIKVDITMPVFYSNRFRTKMDVRPGDYLLVTTFTPFDEDGKPDRSKKLVVFIRAELLKVGG